MSDDMETYRGIAYPREMDHVGHLSTEAHARRFDEATWHFLARLGVTPPYLREEWRDVVVREQHITYLAEVPAGSLLTVRSRLEEVREKGLRIRHVLMCRFGDGPADGRPAATMDVEVAHIDAIRRRSREWPSDVLVRGAQLMRAVVDVQRA